MDLLMTVVIKRLLLSLYLYLFLMVGASSYEPMRAANLYALT